MTSNEDRQRTLDRYDVLDTAPEPHFDRAAEMVALICDATFGFINFLAPDRLFIKASFGKKDNPPSLIPIEFSCCVYTIQQAEPFVVEDARVDPRFCENQFVTRTDGQHLRFYAGVPLIAEGRAIGTVCVLDRNARTVTDDQLRGLHLIAAHVMDLLETRRQLLQLRDVDSLRAEAVEALLAGKYDLEKRVELRTREVGEAHERTRHILERVKDGFVALDKDWKYLYVNERAAEMFGRTPSQLIGKHIWTEFPEGVGQRFHLAYEKAMREQTTITFEEHYDPWDRWFENRIYPSPDGISIFFTEITDRRRTEAELRASEKRLLEAQRIAHVGSWEWDAKQNRVSWSDELHRIYEVPREGFVGTYESFLSYVHPEDLAHTKQVIGEAYAQQQPFEYEHRIVRPSGKIRMLRTQGEVRVSAKGETLALFGSCWDVTDQWRAARRLQRTIALLQATLHASSNEALLVIDVAGATAAVNAPLIELFGIPPEIAQRRDLAIVDFMREELVDFPGVPALGNGEVHRLERKNGPPFLFQAQPQMLDGKLGGWLCRFRPAD